MECQLESGDWPRQSLIGVFNKSALINYENYRRYFPIWALAELAEARRADLHGLFGTDRSTPSIPPRK